MYPSPSPYDNSTFGFQQSAYNSGDICWMPKLEMVDLTLLANYSIPAGALGHPILILSSPDTGESYYACIVSIAIKSPSCLMSIRLYVINLSICCNLCNHV